MPEFLKQTPTPLPEMYKDLISENDYNVFLDKCLTVVKDRGVEVTNLNDGAITYQLESGEEAHFYLDNLLKTCILLPEDQRDDIIKQHFDKLRDRSDAYNYFFKDFDYAKQFLRVMIKPKEMLEKFVGFVHRSDYPNLVTFLVFDFEEQLRYIRNEDAAQWETSDEALFEIALENIASEELEVQEGKYEDRFAIYVLLNGDFSASFTLLMQQELAFAIGTFGSLIAIPTKGTAFLHPIETPDVLDLAAVLHPAVEKFYHEDPGNISRDFYWFYEGEYHLFDKVAKDNETVVIRMPEKLEWLLGQ